MKKQIIAMTFALAGVMGASAQSEIFNNPDNEAYFGARVALDVSIPGNVSMGKISADIFNNGAGLSFGGVYNMPIYANLYFEPGLMFYYNTMGVNKESVESGFEKSSVREFGFEIPVMLGYHFDFNPVKVYLYTGPEVRVGMWGKFRSTATVNGVHMSGSESLYHTLNRADISWRVGVGVSYDRYYLSLSGAAGMCDNIKNEIEYDLKMHRNVFNFTLGYNF